MDDVTTFFIKRSGFSNEVLRKCTEAERLMFAALGSVIFCITFISSLSSGYLFYIIFESLVFASFFGIIWATLIYNFNRFVLSTYIGENRKIRWAFFILRIFLAIVISFIISSPIILKVYDRDIKKSISNTKNETLKKIRFNKDELNKKLIKENELTKQIEDAKNNLELEIEGKKGTGYGRKDAAENKEGRLNDYKNDKNRLDTEIQMLTDTLIIMFSTLNNDSMDTFLINDINDTNIKIIIDDIKNYKPTLLELYKQVNLLRSWSIDIVLLLFFFILELLPVIFIFLKSKGLYEDVSEFEKKACRDYADATIKDKYEKKKERKKAYYDFKTKLEVLLFYTLFSKFSALLDSLLINLKAEKCMSDMLKEYLQDIFKTKCDANNTNGNGKTGVIPPEKKEDIIFYIIIFFVILLFVIIISLFLSVLFQLLPENHKTAIVGIAQVVAAIATIFTGIILKRISKK